MNLDDSVKAEFAAALRTTILVARERGRQRVRELFPIGDRSKYAPHVGAKQRAKQERRESRPA